MKAQYEGTSQEVISCDEGLFVGSDVSWELLNLK